MVYKQRFFQNGMIDRLRLDAGRMKSPCTFKEKKILDFNYCARLKSDEPGKPAFDIPA